MKHSTLNRETDREAALVEGVGWVVDDVDCLEARLRSAVATLHGGIPQARGQGEARLLFCLPNGGLLLVGLLLMA